MLCGIGSADGGDGQRDKGVVGEHERGCRAGWRRPGDQLIEHDEYGTRVIAGGGGYGASVVHPVG